MAAADAATLQGSTRLAARGGKIFVDYLRNRGSTVVRTHGNRHKS